eukprot:TRINITY_DN7564_c0_g1_i7.p1 TRINITY_DN7564_c0_g1~~TRINITY_DN7564_c0_g1_i7.p1  ORF type:complete len:788 (-),score=90.76 TRINITY_DN7564_c0_g1_i7:2285-4648(-)
MIILTFLMYLLMFKYGNISCNPGPNDTNSDSGQNDTSPTNNDTNDTCLSVNDTNYLSCTNLSNVTNSSAEVDTGESSEHTCISEGSAFERIIEEIYQEEVSRSQPASPSNTDDQTYVLWVVALVCLIVGLGWLLVRRQRQNSTGTVFDSDLQRAFHGFARWHQLAIRQILSNTTSTPLWALLQVYLVISSIVMFFFIRVVADTLFYVFYFMGYLASTIQSSVIFYPFRAAVRFMCTLPMLALLHLYISIYCRITGQDYNQIIRYLNGEQAMQPQADEPQANEPRANLSQGEGEEENSDDDNNIPSSSNNPPPPRRRQTLEDTDTVIEDKQSENIGEQSSEKKKTNNRRRGNNRKFKKQQQQTSKQWSTEASSTTPAPSVQIQRQHGPSSSSIPFPTSTLTPQSDSQQQTDTTTKEEEGNKWTEVINKKKQRKQSKQNNPNDGDEQGEQKAQNNGNQQVEQQPLNQAANQQQIQQQQDGPQNAQGQNNHAGGQQQQQQLQNQQPQQQPPNQQQLQPPQEQQPQQQQNVVQQQVNEVVFPIDQIVAHQYQQQALQQPQQQQVQQRQQQRQKVQRQQRQQTSSVLEIQNHQQTIEKLQENVDPDWPTLTQALSAALLAQNNQVQQEQQQQQAIEQPPEEIEIVPYQNEIVPENQVQQNQPQQQVQQQQQPNNPFLIWQNVMPRVEYFQEYEQYLEAFEVYSQFQNQKHPQQHQLNQWQMEVFKQLHMEYIRRCLEEAQEQGYPYNQFPNQPLINYYILPKEEYELQNHQAWYFVVLLIFVKFVYVQKAQP